MSYQARGSVYEKVGSHDLAQKDRGKVAELAQPKYDYKAYVQQAQESVKATWHPPKLKMEPDIAQSLSADCRFLIESNGHVSSIYVSKSSGNKELDDSALATIQHFGAFPALPAGAPDQIQIEINFAYSVHPKKLTQ